MRKIILGLFAFLLLVACTPQDTEQSIQDIVSNTPDFEEVVEEEVAEEVVEENNQTEEIELEEEAIIGKKCRYSAIVYDGCKWSGDEQTEFNIKIVSGSKQSIPGVWFFVTGESGIKTIKMPGEILSEGTRSYKVDYASLVDEIGKVMKFEVYPIEVIDEVEYACQNQRVYTIPETYCKANGPVNAD